MQNKKSKWNFFRLRTDVGTFFLHWGMAAVIIIAMISGFRLSWDGTSIARGFSRGVSGILLQGDVWIFHFISACFMFAFASAYIVYVIRANLNNRNSLSRIKLIFLPGVPSNLRWQSINISLHWLFYIVTTAIFISGILLYLGWGGLIVEIHAGLAMSIVAYLFLHIIGHFFQGGIAQLLRIFIPSKLVEGYGVKSFPFLIALVIGFATSAAITAIDFGTRGTITVKKVAVAPKLDGNILDKEIWKNVSPAYVQTQQGFNLADGKGESLVEVRAVHDGENVYFAFRWQDPSRSIKRLPLIKQADGWHMLNNHADIADESAFYEDKFAVLFSRSDSFNGGVTGLGPKPLDDKPSALNGRGLHYTTDGSYADMWQWKASRGGMLGKIDDMHFGPPLPADEKQMKGISRYSAGYTQDPGKAFYVYNYKSEPPGGFKGAVNLLRLPKDYASTMKKLGKFDLTPGASDDADAQWWMKEDETVLYSKELDDKIPVGTVIPSTLIIGNYEGDRADVDVAAQWKDGWWSLEAKRKLKSMSKYDLDLTEKKPIYMWFSVFDHNQTRHTRHVRPIKVEFAL